MARGLWGAILGCLVSTACAQVITVTSGEHVGFTRLVLQSSERFAWRADLAPRAALLRLPEGAVLRGLEDVFRRIARDRLAGLLAQDAALRLELGCDCALSIWEEGAGVLIIDITPPDAPAAPESPPPGTPFDQALARAAGSALAQERRGTTGEPVADAPTLAPQALLDALSREVARAQSQGLLQPATQAESVPQALIPPPDTGARAAPPHPQLRITTALERPSAEALRLVTEATEAPDCRGIEALDFLEDEGSEPFSEAHSRLLAQSYGEFDLPSIAALSDLIALYLTHAMGAEARALIDIAGLPEPDATYLRALADLLEERPSNALPHLGRAAGCGDIALALALAANSPGLTPDAQSAARAALGFGLLSAPLRMVLGPKLAERLMAEGLGAVARSIIDAIRHEPDLPAPVLSRLDAQLAALQGETAQAVARLHAAGGADGAALRLQLQLSREMGEVPATALLETAEAVAASLRYQDLGSEILFLVGELRAMGGDLAGAVSVIDRAALWARDDPGLRDETRQAEARIWALIAQAPSDADFLETALSREEWRAPHMPIAVTAAVAERLHRFGLGPVPSAGAPAALGPAHPGMRVAQPGAPQSPDAPVPAGLGDPLGAAGPAPAIGAAAGPAPAAGPGAPPGAIAGTGAAAAPADAPPRAQTAQLAPLMPALPLGPVLGSSAGGDPAAPARAVETALPGAGGDPRYGDGGARALPGDRPAPGGQAPDAAAASVSTPEGTARSAPQPGAGEATPFALQSAPGAALLQPQTPNPMQEAASLLASGAALRAEAAARLGRSP